MTIKTIIEPHEGENLEIKYPCLMQFTKGRCVILFREPYHGVVVAGSIFKRVGDLWKCGDMSNYAPFRGKITLEQE